MKKSVLISIQPYWVFLIIARTMGWNIQQDKTVEVRKDFPKDSAWNRRVPIYCSKNRKSFNRIPKEYQPLMAKFLGKVIGEFVCDRIDKYVNVLQIIGGESIELYPNCIDKLHEMCLSEKEFYEYGGAVFGYKKHIPNDFKHGKNLYGWHITDLKIYDTPKELSEFFVKGDCEEEDLCRTCKYYDPGNECAEIEPDCSAYGIKPLTRPPQSWCYVEEIN